MVSLSAHAVIDGRLASADCATRAFCWLLVSVLGSCSFGLEQGRDFSQALYLRALNSNGSLSSTSTGRCLSKHAGLALDSVEGRSARLAAALVRGLMHSRTVVENLSALKFCSQAILRGFRFLGASDARAWRRRTRTGPQAVVCRRRDGRSQHAGDRFTARQAGSAWRGEVGASENRRRARVILSSVLWPLLKSNLGSCASALRRLR